MGNVCTVGVVVEPRKQPAPHRPSKTSSPNNTTVNDAKHVASSNSHRSSEETPLQGSINPFQDLAAKNHQRRVKHQILVERLYENRPPSPRLVELLEDLKAEHAVLFANASSNYSEEGECEDGDDDVTMSSPMVNDTPAVTTKTKTTTCEDAARNPLQTSMGHRSSWIELLDPPDDTRRASSLPPTTSSSEPPSDSSYSAGVDLSASQQRLTEAVLMSMDSEGDTNAPPASALLVSSGGDQIAPQHTSVDSNSCSMPPANDPPISGRMRRDSGRGETNHRRRVSRGTYINEQYQQYLKAAQEIRGILHDEPGVTFVVAHQHSSGSAPHSLGSCALAPPCVPSILVRSTATSVPPKSPSDSNEEDHNGDTSGPDSSAAFPSPTSVVPATTNSDGAASPSTHRRESATPLNEQPCTPPQLRTCISLKRLLHISPKCSGFLTDDVQRKLMRGKSDNAHFVEDVHFVRMEE